MGFSTTAIPGVVVVDPSVHSDARGFFLETYSEPRYRGMSLFVYLLPYLESSNLGSLWNYDDPAVNTVGGAEALSATIEPLFLCPTDVVPKNPVERNGVYYALSSYGGNGGRFSYFPDQATVDGLFHTTGAASEPEAGQSPVKIAQVTDGTAHTLLFVTVSATAFPSLSTTERCVVSPPAD